MGFTALGQGLGKWEWDYSSLYSGHALSTFDSSRHMESAFDTADNF